MNREAQRTEALEKANRVRSARRLLKAELREGRTSLHRVLYDPPPCIDSMKMVDVLTTRRGLGPMKAERALRRSHVGPNRALGDLTRREIDAVVDALLRLPSGEGVVNDAS